MRLAALILLTATAVVLRAAAAQTLDERATARDVVVKKRGDAAMTALTKLRINIGGRNSPTIRHTGQRDDSRQHGSDRVVRRPSLQPDDVMSRTLSQRVAAGTKVDVTSEPSDIRMHLADGRELAVSSRAARRGFRSLALTPTPADRAEPTFVHGRCLDTGNSIL